MVLRDSVHKGGVASFATLPGDSYEYRIDYEQSEGAVWLKSRKTEREWECMIYNCDVFEEDPVYRDQFTMEITLLELALHHDPRVHKTDVCKNVILTRSGDDLAMQLSERVYTRRNPEWGPTLQFTLEWVRGSGTLPHGMSRDPPMPLEPEEPPKPKVTRDEQQKELLTRLRDENKALKAAKRERASEVKQWKTENDALRRENAQLKLANDAQYAQLIKLGGSHEFQRQHIEHLRRKIQALEQQQQIAQPTAYAATVAAAAAQQNTVSNLIDVESSESSDDQDDEQQEAEQESAESDNAGAAPVEQNKRRRTSERKCKMDYSRTISGSAALAKEFEEELLYFETLDPVALNSALHEAHETNKRLREELMAAEARLLATKVSHENEIEERRARIEKVENPPGGQDLEALQTEFETHITGIRRLAAKVGKTKMRLCLVPAKTLSDRSKRQRIEDCLKPELN